jgi:hypothetical protein
MFLRLPCRRQRLRNLKTPRYASVVVVRSLEYFICVRLFVMDRVRVRLRQKRCNRFLMSATDLHNGWPHSRPMSSSSLAVITVSGYLELPSSPREQAIHCYCDPRLAISLRSLGMAYRR